MSKPDIVKNLVSIYPVFLDAIASPSTFPCQWVSE